MPAAQRRDFGRLANLLAETVAATGSALDECDDRLGGLLRARSAGAKQSSPSPPWKVDVVT